MGYGDMDEAVLDEKSVETLLTDARGEKFREDVPQSYRRVYQTALLGNGSPRSAIKAFCLRCVGYTRADITGCTSYACPLHKFRPYQ